MSGRLIDRNRGAKIIPGAYPYAHLQLIVQPLAGGQDGRIGIGSPDLSLRPFQRRAADLNRGCAAMIATRHIFVIGEQRIVGPKRSEEHTSDLKPLMRTPYAVFRLK